MSFTTPKVFVIGVDGATWDVIRPMVEKGQLPNFAKLMQESAWGALRSTIPHVSPVAWTSFMTGQNPARHGILDFMMEQKGHDQPMAVNSHAVASRTLWRILSDADRKVGVINVPVTFPPEEVNGFLVSGFPMPLNTDDYCYPPSLAAELEAHGWHLSDIAGQTISKDELPSFIAGLYRRHNDRVEATLWLMEEHEWDLFVVHLFETDRIQHELFNYWTDWKAGKNGNMARRYGPELERFMQSVDDAIGQLWQRVEETEPGSTLVILSDHGFGPTHRAAHLYNWLLEAGLMQLKPTTSVKLKQALSKVGLTPVNGYRLLPHGVRKQLRSDKDITYLEKAKESPGPIRAVARALRRVANGLLLHFDDVDWEKSRAYCVGVSGIIHISVNLQGREPRGSVPLQEYDVVREEIIAALRAWRDPWNGEPVVSEIYRREEIYSGPFLDKAADILALFQGDSEYVSFTGPYFLSNRAIDKHNYMAPDRATHKMEGIILIKDERVVPGERIDAQILDVAPTMLHLMGLAIPSTMDGSPIEDCFAPSWLENHQPRIVEVEPDVVPGQDDDSALTDEEEESMLEMLRGLGYVQ